MLSLLWVLLLSLGVWVVGSGVVGIRNVVVVCSGVCGVIVVGVV